MILLMELESDFMIKDSEFWKKWRNSHNYDIGYKGYTVLKGIVNLSKVKCCLVIVTGSMRAIMQMYSSICVNCLLLIN